MLVPSGLLITVSGKHLCVFFMGSPSVAWTEWLPFKFLLRTLFPCEKWDKRLSWMCWGHCLLCLPILSWWVLLHPPLAESVLFWLKFKLCGWGHVLILWLYSTKCKCRPSAGLRNTTAAEINTLWNLLLDKNNVQMRIKCPYFAENRSPSSKASLTCNFQCWRIPLPVVSLMCILLCAC